MCGMLVSPPAKLTHSEHFFFLSCLPKVTLTSSSCPISGIWSTVFPNLRFSGFSYFRFFQPEVKITPKQRIVSSSATVGGQHPTSASPRTTLPNQTGRRKPPPPPSSTPAVTSTATATETTTSLPPLFTLFDFDQFQFPTILTSPTSTTTTTATATTKTTTATTTASTTTTSTTTTSSFLKASKPPPSSRISRPNAISRYSDSVANLR